jgi:hypothetical protein
MSLKAVKGKWSARTQCPAAVSGAHTQSGLFNVEEERMTFRGKHRRVPTKQLRFEADDARAGRAVGAGRSRRPRSAETWSQGLALAALSPRTRRRQALERRRSGASYRAAVNPRDELCVAAREFAPARSADDVVHEASLPVPAAVRVHHPADVAPSNNLVSSSSGSTATTGVDRGAPPPRRPNSAATPAYARPAAARVRPHTAGSSRHGTRTAPADRRPSTAQRQRIQQYRESERQVLVNKQADEDEQLHSAGFQRHGQSWRSRSSEDLRAEMSVQLQDDTVAEDADKEVDGPTDSLARERLAEIDHSHVLQQYHGTIEASEAPQHMVPTAASSRSQFFAFVAEQRQQLAGSRPELTAAELASELSQCWQDREVKELSGSHASGVAGSGRERAEQNLTSVRRRISWEDSGSGSSSSSSIRVPLTSMGRSRVPQSRVISLPSSSYIGAVSSWQRTQQPAGGMKPGGASANSGGRGGAGGAGGARISDSLDGTDLLQVTRLAVPSSPADSSSSRRSRSRISHTPERAASAPGNGEGQQHDQDPAAVGCGERLQRLPLAPLSPGPFVASAHEPSQRFSEPISGHDSLLQRGW